MRDLAPAIFRQRLVVEGTPSFSISDRAIADYLSDLSGHIGMVTLTAPVTHRSDKYGWAGWIHWETSGAHFYAWDVPQRFFSVDIYTCKQFEVDAAVTLTRERFGAAEIAWKSF
jgi:S-adenosylmethionine decarboxylase